MNGPIRKDRWRNWNLILYHTITRGWLRHGLFLGESGIRYGYVLATYNGCYMWVVSSQSFLGEKLDDGRIVLVKVVVIVCQVIGELNTVISFDNSTYVCMTYWYWSGVYLRQPDIGRCMFAVACFILYDYIVYVCDLEQSTSLGSIGARVCHFVHQYNYLWYQIEGVDFRYLPNQNGPLYLFSLQIDWAAKSGIWFIEITLLHLQLYFVYRYYR